jgi:hypothetical protein
MRPSLLNTATATPVVPDLSTLPIRVDRRQAAELVARYFFPASPRSLEAWPLTVTYANGRALLETAALFAEAQRRLDAAPRIMGGRPPRHRSPIGAFAKAG